jgi:hypothetical protein
MASRLRGVRVRGALVLLAVVGVGLLGTATPASGDRADGLRLSPGSRVCVGPVDITEVGTAVYGRADRSVRWTVRTYDQPGGPPTEIFRLDGRSVARTFRQADTDGALIEHCVENTSSQATAYTMYVVPQPTGPATVHVGGTATSGTEACLSGDLVTSRLVGSSTASLRWEVRLLDPSDDTIRTIRTIVGPRLDTTETPSPGLALIACAINTGPGAATFDLDIIPT